MYPNRCFFFFHFPMSTLAQSCGDNRQLLWTTGFVVAMLFNEKVVSDITWATVSFTFVFPPVFFLLQMCGSPCTRALNECLNVRQQMKFCSWGLCVQTGSTGPTEWITNGRVLFPINSCTIKNARLCTRCKVFVFEI